MSAEESFAINLKLLRTKSRNTQKQMANTFGVALATYRNWEYGSSTPKINVLSSICRHYQVSAQAGISSSNVNPTKLLIIMPELITDNSKMGFGQYKGYPLVSVPASYLLFLHDNEKAGRYAPYIKENLSLLVKQAKKEKKR